MAYTLHTGLRLEDLVTEHASAFRAPLVGLQPLIVVQNQSLAQWLKLHLARLWDGYATGDLVFQDEALRRLMDWAGASGERAWFLDELKYALFCHLSEVLKPGCDPVFEPLTGGKPVDQARIFELADHISGTFHGYAMNSLVWPHALATGQNPIDRQVPPSTFDWQSKLWQNLFGADPGRLAGTKLQQLIDNPPPVQGPRLTVVLVGSAFLSRKAAAFIRAWADTGRIDVTHLLLLPGPAPTIASPLRPWSSWGTFGKAFLDGLQQPTTETTVLGSQRCLGALQGALARGEALSVIEPDESLEVLSCPHPLRELELVRDRLLSALASDPTLQMNDLAVLAPDINRYAPFLDAAFRLDDEGRRLPFHVIDLDLGRENRWFQGLDALLALVSGTIDRPNLFALVDSEAFQKAWELRPEDRDLWLDYTEEISAWRQGERLQSWSSGADRLMEGWFRSRPVPGEAPPLSVVSSVFPTLDRLHELVDQLESWSRETSRPRTLGAWVTFLEGIVLPTLGSGEGTLALLSSRLRTLEPVVPGAPLTWMGFRSFVQDQIAHFPGRRGQLLTEGVHCSSLRPLRALPFRVVAVVGLDEAVFPHRSTIPAFDLRRWEDDQDQVSPLALDRYTFWETLMAARDRLILSYQGFSAIDGAPRPPSPVLADLLDYLETSGQSWPIIRATVKDFAVTGPTLTYSPQTARRIQAFLDPDSQPSFQERGSEDRLDDPFPEAREDEVLRAFTAPVQFFLRRVAQVRLRDEDHRGQEDEEPWSLDFVEARAWLSEGFTRYWDGVRPAWDPETFLDEAEKTGHIRPGVFADRDRRDLTNQVAQLSAWCERLSHEGWQPSSRPARQRWAGKPWAQDQGLLLVRGPESLIPMVLWAQDLSARTRQTAALQVLQRLPQSPQLQALAPDGRIHRQTWIWDDSKTRALAEAAEEFWLTAITRPLPHYPDLLAILAKLREKAPDQPWPEAVAQSWEAARVPTKSLSTTTLAADPYVALAYPTDEVPPGLADDLGRWWDPLWKPLMGAWE